MESLFISLHPELTNDLAYVDLPLPEHPIVNITSLVSGYQVLQVVVEIVFTYNVQSPTPDLNWQPEDYKSTALSNYS